MQQEPHVSSAVHAQPVTVRRRLRLGMAAKQAAFGYAILLPTLAILFIFRFLPMIQAFVISLQQYDLIHPPQVRRLRQLRRPAAGPAVPATPRGSR